MYSVVPASIVAESSTGDVIVKEGDTVILTCNATGIPQPEVTWYRRSSLAFKLGLHAKRKREYDYATVCSINRSPDISHGHIPLDIFPPDIFPSRKIPIRFLHGVGHFPRPPPASGHLQYKAIYR